MNGRVLAECAGGLVVTRTLIASLLEPGRLDRRGQASLVCTARLNRDSWLMRVELLTWGGRSDLRIAL